MWIFIIPLTFTAIKELIKLYCLKNISELETNKLILKEEKNMCHLTLKFYEKEYNPEIAFSHYVQEWLYFKKILDIINAINLTYMHRVYIIINILIIVLFIIGWGTSVYLVTMSYIEVYAIKFLFFILPGL